MLEKLENNEIQLNNQSEVIDELKRLINTADPSENEVKYILYTVKKEIRCRKFAMKNIDFYSNRNIILSLNGIDNPNNIFVGQDIILPIVTKTK